MTALTTTVVRTIDDAMARGALLRTRSAAVLDDIERVLATGVIDEASRTPVGSGMNGVLTKVRITDVLDGARSVEAVEKTAAQQAAQEAFGWRIARELGIDYLVAAVARRADGTARIELRPGVAANMHGIDDARSLEAVLAKSYANDATLGLNAAQAARAGRVDRQLLQFFDYLIANNDRHGGNALHDAVTGAFSFIDEGHAGRGQLAKNGGTVLEPALRRFQAGDDGGRVDLDPAVIEYLRRRTSADRLRAIHAAVFDRTDVAGPPAGTVGERFLRHVNGLDYREGVTARFEHAIANAGYVARPYSPDAGDWIAPRVDVDPDARGVGNVRNEFMRAGGFF